MESLGISRFLNFEKSNMLSSGYNSPVYEAEYNQPIFPIQNAYSPFCDWGMSSYSYSPSIYSFYSMDNGRFFDSDLYLRSFATFLPPSVPLFMDFFQMPEFNIPMLSLFSSGTKNKTRKTSTNPFSSNYSFNTSTKYRSLNDAGYNSQLANRLAQDIASHVCSGSTGYCAKYVSNSLERLGISGARGDAWQLKNSLRVNPHFKEIDVASVDVKKLPAGCILVYDRGAGGYSRKYGHVEITLGNGKAASDFINNNIVSTSNMTVFVPVSA